jgi:glycosyltransferase involved in cell wall biosynthesis
MRICMLAYEFPGSPAEPIVSGEVKNPYYLARGLMARGHQVTVVSLPFLTRSVRVAAVRPNSNPPTYDVPDGRLRSAARYVLRIRNVERFFGSELPGRAFDVVHAQSPALAAGALRARRRGTLSASTPIVTTAHGTYVPEVEGDRVKRSVREILRAASARLTLNIDRDAFRASDAVVAASRFQEAEMADLYKVPRAKIAVIHNGVDTEFYRPDGPAADLAGTSMGPDDRVILFVGRLVPKKGLQHLIAAFPGIVDSVPNARCLVVGGSRIFDTYGPALRDMVRSGGLDGRFVWRQDVPEDEMPALYRRASVCAFPSMNYESLPTVALEAMACGIPVVATNSWGMPEALGPDHPGLVPQSAPRELARAIVAVLSQPGVAAEAGRDQRERIGAFSLDACVAKHEELYARVAATK